jgi:hypothetical protein
VNAPSSTPAQKPSITLQPKDAYYYLPDSPAVAALTVTATSGDGGALTYQWYSGNTHGAAGTSIGGATSSSYTPLTSAGDTKFYYCVVTNTLSGNISTTKSGAVVIIMDNAAAYTGPAGTGTAADPFIVHDVTTLQRVAKGIGAWTGNWSRSASYKQVRHISLPTVSAGNSNWSKIGVDIMNPFSGSYDGGGYTINNLTMNMSSYSEIGMFVYISGSNAIVKNVGLVNCDIKGGPYVGGIVVYNIGIMENCYVTGNVSGSGSVGGVVGGNEGTIANCYATGNVSGGTGVGGVVGSNSSTMKNCYATGNVSGSSNYVGGVVGWNDDSGTVQNCYSTGNVSGIYVVGGVVGGNSTLGTAKYCIALNPNITTNSTNFGRVLYNGSSSTMTNNYGRSDMKKDEIATTWTSSANGKDGADITATEWNSASWWTGTANFNSTVWDISNGKLPTLKNMPGNPVQNPVVQPLP